MVISRTTADSMVANVANFENGGTPNDEDDDFDEEIQIQVHFELSS